jgi:hypothetical protein
VRGNEDTDMRQVAISLIALLALSACQRAPTPPAATPTAGNATPAANANAEKPASGFLSMFSEKTEPAPVDMGEFKIVSITLGNSIDAEHRVSVNKTVFERNDRIYAAVLSTGQHQGLKLSAKWTTADGQLISESNQALVPTTATVTTFSLHNADPWPAGKYQLVVSLDERPQDVLSFEIR